MIFYFHEFLTFCTLFQCLLWIFNNIIFHSNSKFHKFLKWCKTHHVWLQCIEWFTLRDSSSSKGISDQGHAEEKQPPSCCWGIYLISQSNSFFTRIFTPHSRSCRVEILCRALSLLRLTGRVSRAAAHARFYNTKYVVFFVSIAREWFTFCIYSMKIRARQPKWYVYHKSHVPWNGILLKTKIIIIQT